MTTTKVKWPSHSITSRCRILTSVITSEINCCSQVLATKQTLIFNRHLCSPLSTPWPPSAYLGRRMIPFLNLTQVLRKIFERIIYKNIFNILSFLGVLRSQVLPPMTESQERRLCFWLKLCHSSQNQISSCRGLHLFLNYQAGRGRKEELGG